MSQRPQFWIHRSSRFWSGLLILFALVAAWIFSMKRGYHAYNWKDQPGSSISATYSLTNGGLRLDYLRFNSSRILTKVPSTWHFSQQWSGARLAPEFEWRDRSDSDGSHRSVIVFLPLWIGIVAWICLWLMWMRRGDKREEMLYGAQREEPGSTTSGHSIP